MEDLKTKLLDVIASGLPDTLEMQEFCGSQDFADMLDNVIKIVADHITFDPNK